MRRESLRNFTVRESESVNRWENQQAMEKTRERETNVCVFSIVLQVDTRERESVREK